MPPCSVALRALHHATRPRRSRHLAVRSSKARYTPRTTSIFATRCRTPAPCPPPRCALLSASFAPVRRSAFACCHRRILNFKVARYNDRTIDATSYFVTIGALGLDFSAPIFWLWQSYIVMELPSHCHGFFCPRALLHARHPTCAPGPRAGSAVRPSTLYGIFARAVRCYRLVSWQ